jgi:hypothetical protein
LCKNIMGINTSRYTANKPTSCHSDTVVLCFSHSLWVIFVVSIMKRIK